MDPTAWPLWAKILAGWGPLGIWAGLATWAYIRSEKAHHASRDKNDAAVKTLNEDHATLVKTMGVEFAVKLKEAAEQHHEEMHEMTDRLISTTEGYAEKNRQLTEKVAVLVEALGRRGSRGG